MQKRILTLICVLIFIMAFAGCEKNNSQPDTAPGAEATPTQTEDPNPNDETTTEEVNFEEDPCCDLTDTAPAVSEKGQPFGMDDIHAGGFKIGDAKDDVLAKAGTPLNSYDVDMEATGEVRNINEFSFGNLVFVDNKLVVIQVVDDTIEGPRGIHVGMNLNEVTQLFANTIELDTDYMTILYRDNVGGDENFAVPPSGVLYKGDMQTLSFAIFTEDSAFDMSADELAEGGYMYVEQYDLVCEFDSEGTMLSYAVRIGAPAE